MEITEVGITTNQERTWGRVYVNYTKNGESFFAFRNYLKFQKKNFFGEGDFQSEPAFTWFHVNKITENYQAVLDGEYDNMKLTPSNYKSAYGTPSKLLKSLIDDINRDDHSHVESRRGWY